MYNENLFKKNCQRWALFYPEAAKKVSKLQSSKHIQLTNSTNGSLNLQTTVDGQPAFYHSTVNPEAEAATWFAKTDVHNVTVLFVFGIGLGYAYTAAKAWLSENKSRTLVFFEDNFEVLYHLLHTDLAHELLYNRQVRLVYIDHSMTSIRDITTTYALRHYTTTALELYAKARTLAFDLIKAKIALFMDPKMSAANEYRDHGRKFTTNYCKNLLALPSAALGAKLYGQFTNVPAIVCGAGPSLGKNLQLLATLRDKALIFAGGTAMNALNTIGFLPHFGVGIDPNPAQFTRLVMNQAFEVPYFYSNRLLHEALSLIHGTHLYLPGSTGYTISDWFEKQLGMKESDRLNEGCSVLNYSLSIAHALGCNPIIFVGADLAYTKQQAYAPNIHNHPIHLRKAYFVTKSASEDIITKPDIYGQPIHTLSKWVAESNFVTQFAALHNEKTVINATEGGLGFISVANITLEEVAKTYLQKEYDFDVTIPNYIEQAQLHISKKALQLCMSTFQQSLERCEQASTLLHTAYEELEAKIRTNNKVYSLSEPGKKALQGLQNEPGYNYHLKQFSEKYTEMHQLALEDIKFEADKVGELETQARKAHFEKGRWAYLALSAKINSDIFIESLTIEQDNNKNQPLKPPIVPAKMPAIAKKDGHFHGLQQTYYADGTLKSEIPYKMGQIDGEVRLYFPSGALKRQLHFSEGKRHGTEKIFNEDGSLYIEAEFDNDMPTKTARQWHPNGILALEINYENDPSKFSIQEWDQEGHSQPTNANDASDYFDEMAEQTQMLTLVLGHLVQQITALEPVVDKIRATAKLEQATALENIHTELEHFKKLGQELMKKSGVDPASQESELYWKGPAAQREVEQKMRQLISQLSKKLISINNTLTSLLTQ